MIRLFLIVTLLITLIGCAGFMPPQPNDPYYAPRYPNQTLVTKQNNGSLFHQPTSMMLFEDKKASQVGDIITVVLTESTDASKKADTEMKKETDVTLPNPTLGGTNVSFDNGTKSFQLGLESDNKFKGESDSAQSNKLTGTISVTVQEVLPNGNLFVRGEKWLTLNQGDEFIRVSGIIRPDDVSATNQVMSTRMANARIQYSGTGSLAESNKQGWLSQFFNSSWWPF